MFNPNATDIDGPILFSPENEKELATLIQRYPYKRAALIPVLHMAQSQFGWLSPGVMAYVAQRLELPEGKVLQVASFYTMFDKKPAGRHKVEVCTSVPCCTGARLAGALSVKWRTGSARGTNRLHEVKVAASAVRPRERRKFFITIRA